MAHGVDAMVHVVQPAPLEPVADRSTAKSDLEQLPAGDHAVLAFRQLRERAIQTDQLGATTKMLLDTYVVLNCVLVGHARMVAPVHSRSTRYLTRISNRSANRTDRATSIVNAVRA